MPDTRLALSFGKSTNWVWRRRVKCGIAKFSGSLPRTSYNIHAFDEIDAEGAYWLGFYFADGCVCATRNRRLVVLSSRDREVIEKLCKFYGDSTCSLMRKLWKEGDWQYSLSLCNKWLFDKLTSLGCVPRKSLIVSRPNIEAVYFDAFLLGLFDGDGSISLNRTINQWKVSIGTGSEKLVDWLGEILTSKQLIYSFEKRKKKRAYFFNVVLTGLAALSFLKNLYNSNEGLCPLSRKKSLYVATQ